MNDILEFIEDLERLDTLKNHPAFEEALDEIRAKYHKRVDDYEYEMERQIGFDFHA
jgi:hypothetical protein